MHTHNLYVKPFRIRKTIDNNIKKTVSKPINQGTSTHLHYRIPYATKNKNNPFRHFLSGHHPAVS